MSALPTTDDPRILVDHRTGDDAGVFLLDEGRALVQTVDFFTPVVDDPESFGAIATALKAGRASDAAVSAAARSMAALNREASEAAVRHGVTGATDVTGFGLLGHAGPLARASGVTLEIDAREVPLLPEVIELAASHQATGLKANRLAFEPHVDDDGLDEVHRTVFYDPQTSGGLLLLVPDEEGPALLGAVAGARAIGRATPDRSH